jgi:hypothetical protein
MIATTEATIGRPEPASAGELTLAERNDTIRKIEEIQVAEGISNERVARMLGVSGATWSLIRKGTYKGNTDKHVALARAWLERRQTRKQEPEAEYVETQIGQRIIKTCRFAADMTDCALVLTPSGAGKTAALREFARRRGEQAIYMQAGEYANSKVAVLREVGRRIGAKMADSNTLEEVAQKVREALAESYNRGVGEPKILIVDEAQTLRPPALNMLRNLHDDPECRLVLILADTWRLYGELGRLHGIAGGYEQLRSRFGCVCVVRDNEPALEADVRAIAQATVDAQGHGHGLEGPALSYLVKLAGQPGRLRNVVKRLRACYRLAEAAGRPARYTVTELDRAAEVVGQYAQLRHVEPAAEPAETHYGAADTKTA